MSGLGAYRLFRVTVVATERITPGFVRITLTGEDLDDFGYVGIDQRVKLLLPAPNGAVPELTGDSGDWYEQWCALEPHEQPPMRTYTPRLLRAADPAAGTPASIVIDFAWHADAGPAADWAGRAVPGDVAAIVGPSGEYAVSARAVGWLPPADASTFLIVGDETALPAIAGILESLDPAQAAVRVVLELGNPADAALIAAPDWVTVEVHERGERTYGEALVAAVAALDDPAFAAGAAASELEDVNVDTTVLWEVPGLDPLTGLPLESDTRSARAYAWLAGEAGAIKLIRRELVANRGMARDAVAFMGYWRIGKAES